MRKRLLSIVAVLLLAMLLAACGSGASTGGAPANGNSAPGTSEPAGETEDAKLGGSIVVAEYGGTVGSFVRANVTKPFEEETDVTVHLVPGLTMQNLAKLRASKDDPELDVVGFDPPGAYPAADEGLLLKLDPEKLPNMNNLYDWAIAKDGHLVGVLADNQCIAYNTDFVTTPPTSWHDLWKEEYKGKVILPDISTSHGMYVIMMASKLVTGDDLYDAEAAFDLLETLKDDVLTYYTGHDQVAQLLNSGQGWIVPWVADRAAAQQDQGAPIDCVVPEEGGIFFVSFGAIAKNTKNPDAAYAYLNKWISAEVQTAAAKEVFLGPTNKDAVLEGKPLEFLDPNRPNLIRPDWDKLIEYGPEWTDLWNKRMK